MKIYRARRFHPREGCEGFRFFATPNEARKYFREWLNEPEVKEFAEKEEKKLCEPVELNVPVRKREELIEWLNTHAAYPNWTS
jgi:hypothetical protein